MGCGLLSLPIYPRVVETEEDMPRRRRTGKDRDAFFVFINGFFYKRGGIMRKTIFWISACIILLAAGTATAGPVEISGGLNLTGISGTDGVTFPDTTKQTSAGVTSVESGGGLAITSPGVISIAPGGVGDAMLATGISGSKIITGSISQSQVAPIRAPVLNTGQLITYAEGDDGNLKYGTAVTAFSRFTDNGNGTVTDNLTGLIWLQDANCFGIQTWTDALSSANTLANGACSGSLADGSVAGDWRLPNINELESLIDASNIFPALPTGHPFINVESYYYYSSTSNAPPLTSNVWYVHMAGGYVNNSGAGGCRAWPVRGGSIGKARLPRTGQTPSYGTGDDGAFKKGVVWPSPRFIDNSDGTVTDNLTGLIWLKDANCFVTQDWMTALNSANTLANGACNLTDGSAAGDWRLPSRRELRSLVDYSKSNPALPTGHPFLSVQSGSYWSSTTYAPGTMDAWFVRMNDGYVYDGTKTNSNYVWPVRGGQ